MSFAAAQAAELPDLGGRTVKAVTENAYVPLNFADPKTGEGIGWEYDAFNEIAKRLNLKVEWNLSSWDTMIQAVREGQFDVGMDGITINDERKTQVDFSDPYMVSEQFMLVRADERPLHRRRELRRQRGASGRRAGRHDEFLRRRLQRARRRRGQSAHQAVRHVRRVGAGAEDRATSTLVLMDKTSAAGYIGAAPGAFKMVGEPLGTDEFGFIFKPGSDLVAPVNAAHRSR